MTTAHESIFKAINGVYRDPKLSLDAANAVLEALGLTEVVEQDSEPGSPRWRHYATPRERVTD